MPIALESFSPEWLYLVGDTFHSLRAAINLYKDQVARSVIDAIRQMAVRGTRVIMLPGNHDWQFAERQTFELWKIVPHAFHTTTRGERWLVSHGDIFDRWSSLSSSSLGKRLASCLYPALVSAGNRLQLLGVSPPHFTSHWCSYWKMRIDSTLRHADKFRDYMLTLASEHGCDGVICGHIHQPDLKRFGKFTYVNCGDWVEHCSIAVEMTDGELKVVRSTYRQKR